LDVSHVGFYESLIDQVSDPEDLACVVHTAKMFYKLYGDIFRDLGDRFLTKEST